MASTIEAKEDKEGRVGAPKAKVLLIIIIIILAFFFDLVYQLNRSILE